MRCLSLSKQCIMNVMLVSYAPLGFSFIEMLRIKYLAHFLDSHSFDWNVTVSLTFSIFSTVKKVVTLEGTINMLTKTPIDEFNDKSYRQISRHDLSVLSVLVERQ